MTILRFIFSLLALTASAFAAIPAPALSNPVRTTQSFDANWRFNKGDAPGAEKPEFADASWRQLNLPHDWSIEGPFERNAPATGSGAFLPTGVGWYRKSFTLPVDAAQKRVFIEFDGVMQNSDVWINGQHLGHRPYGYVSFRYELTGKLELGPNAANVLAVRADTSAQPASRWYAGSGIYRHVRLIVTDAVHLEPWATFVSTPTAAADRATVRVQTSVLNQSTAAREVALRVNLVDPAGKTIATADTPVQSVAAGKSSPFERELEVAAPQLWNLDSPQLYRAVVAVRANNTTLDDETVSFGIRESRFESATGYWLNGKNLKLKGVCLHHEGGAFGAAVPLAVWEQRLNTLRELGVNAIRTSHNPFDPGFLDLCDRMGFLVMDELFDCWTVEKNPHDYHKFFNEWSKIDVRDTVRRDRNHPSVILWSTGNEIHDTPKEELAKQILAGLVATFHENDPTRPVTQALFRPNVSHDYTNGLADMLDVIGTNYRDAELLAAWKAKPGRKIVGTEQGHQRSTWLAARDNPHHAGQFIWTGIDYLGESRVWPNVAQIFGIVDRAGTPRAFGYERQSWWSEKPMVHATRRIAATEVSLYDPGYEPSPTVKPQVLYSDWTPRNAQPHDENVEVYSNAEEVELFLNEKSLGAKPLPPDAAPRNWRVAYAPGTLKAVARNKGQIVASHELRTAGPAAKILLATDRAKLTPEWEDVSRVVATVVDANGIPVPSANHTLAFAISGSGAIAAVDNGDNGSIEPFQATQRRVFNSTAIAWVRAKATVGKITLTASAESLARGELILEAVGAPPR